MGSTTDWLKQISRLYLLKPKIAAELLSCMFFVHVFGYFDSPVTQCWASTTRSRLQELILLFEDSPGAHNPIPLVKTHFLLPFEAPPFCHCI